MYLVTSIIVLSFLGMLDAGYLYYKHAKKQTLVCPVNGGCSEVVSSKWSTVFGIRNEILGFLYYAFMSGVFVSSFFIPAYFDLLLSIVFITSGIGFLYSLFLTGLQMVVIKKYCLYCIVSAGITTLLFLALGSLYFSI